MSDRGERLDPRLDDLVELADLDELVRAVDALCDERRWTQLDLLRGRCLFAGHDTGRPLWPIATLADYRLALLAPGPLAAAAVLEAATASPIGPLTEVVACRHTWGELADHLDPSPLATYIAHERVLRGEDLRGVAVVDERVRELPLALQSWEPSYALADYTSTKAEFPAPATVPMVRAKLPKRAAERLEDPQGTAVFRELVAPWTAGSNGTCEVRCVHGDHLDAVAAMGVSAARVAPLHGAQALARLGWAGASGGAHGKRRGAAAGRWEAWWVAAELAGLSEHWPVPPDALGDAVEDLRWWQWDADEPRTGWTLHLAVHDPGGGTAWAVAAIDTA
jgi:hypothetical protein